MHAEVVHAQKIKTINISLEIVYCPKHGKTDT